jgi:hypothetical protein
MIDTVQEPRHPVAFFRTLAANLPEDAIITLDVGEFVYWFDSGFPAGNDLDEAKLNYALRRIWENSSAHIDLIVVGGFQKRKINTFCTASRRYAPADTTFQDRINEYESDFGTCRILTTRWVPHDVVLLLDSSRISVLPLTGRSFHFKPLASAGDIDAHCTPQEKAGVDRALGCAVVGAPQAIRDGVSRFIAQHRPDELLLTANIFEHAARLRSFALAMDACAA